MKNLRNVHIAKMVRMTIKKVLVNRGLNILSVLNMSPGRLVNKNVMILYG